MRQFIWTDSELSIFYWFWFWSNLIKIKNKTNKRTRPVAWNFIPPCLQIFQEALLKKKHLYWFFSRVPLVTYTCTNIGKLLLHSSQPLWVRQYPAGLSTFGIKRKSKHMLRAKLQLGLQVFTGLSPWALAKRCLWLIEARLDPLSATDAQCICTVGVAVHQTAVILDVLPLFFFFNSPEGSKKIPPIQSKAFVSADPGGWLPLVLSIKLCLTAMKTNSSTSIISWQYRLTWDLSQTKINLSGKCISS